MAFGFHFALANFAWSAFAEDESCTLRILKYDIEKLTTLRVVAHGAILGVIPETAEREEREERIGDDVFFTFPKEIPANNIPGENKEEIENFRKQQKQANADKLFKGILSKDKGDVDHEFELPELPETKELVGEFLLQSKANKGVTIQVEIKCGSNAIVPCKNTDANDWHDTIKLKTEDTMTIRSIGKKDQLHQYDHSILEIVTQQLQGENEQKCILTMGFYHKPSKTKALQKAYNKQVWQPGHFIIPSLIQTKDFQEPQTKDSLNLFLIELMKKTRADVRIGAQLADENTSSALWDHHGIITTRFRRSRKHTSKKLDQVFIDNFKQYILRKGTYNKKKKSNPEKEEETATWTEKRTQGLIESTFGRRIEVDTPWRYTAVASYFTAAFSGDVDAEDTKKWFNHFNCHVAVRYIYRNEWAFYTSEGPGCGNFNTDMEKCNKHTLPSSEKCIYDDEMRLCKVDIPVKKTEDGNPACARDNEGNQANLKQRSSVQTFLGAKKN